MPLVDPFTLLLIAALLVVGLATRPATIEETKRDSRPAWRRHLVGPPGAALGFLFVGLGANYAAPLLGNGSQLNIMAGMVLYLCSVGLLVTIAFLIGSGIRRLVAGLTRRLRGILSRTQ